MESIALQTASSTALLPTLEALPSACSSRATGKRSSLSVLSKFSSNCRLFSRTHEGDLPSHAPRAGLCTVWGCSPAQSLNNGRATSTSNCISTKGKIFVKAEDNAQAQLLKTKGREAVEGLKGSCIYLVGMMGSGKTTVGKLVAEALDYEFFDSDKLIEDAAGGLTVAQFFKQQDEEKFRNAETEVLKELSSNGRSVVATGGGIVVRPINWNYLRYGVTVWLDVPLEALAERVVAVGTHTRPLLGESQGDSAHRQALARLSSIYECRAPFYGQADVIVSLQKLASHLGYQHVRDLTPVMLAVQVLEEIKRKNSYTKQKDVASAA